MKRIKSKSKNLIKENIEELKNLFPEVFNEGKVNFNVLKQILGDASALDEDKERFGLNWRGKKQSRQVAITPTAATLKPCPNESEDWDNTENLFIEGDNLEVLKILQNSYAQSVKMIYIDPPYNTGKDFIYTDKWGEGLNSYLHYTGQKDEDGINDSDIDKTGRRHSNWLAMIHPRLHTARKLLTDDGVIFISCDDNEQANLRLLCDDVFGGENFISNVIWSRKRGKDNSAKFLSRNHEYVLIYAKNISLSQFGRLEMHNNTRKAYTNPDNDQRGDYRLQGIWSRGSQGGSKYTFTNKSGQSFSERLWLVGFDTINNLDMDNRLVFKGDKIYKKLFLSEYKGNIPETIWIDVSNTANAADEIKAIFGFQVFDTAKPIPYITKMLKLGCQKNNDDIILDFFAGSSTTAHAVMNLNKDDGGNRKYIMVQLPEIDEKTAAFKAGYKNIAEIGKERIRQVAEKIKREKPNYKGDLGFKVFKLSESCIKEWKPNKDDLQQSLIEHESRIKPETTEQELMYEIMLNRGIPLSCSIEKRSIGNNSIYNIHKGFMFMCLDEKILRSGVGAISSNIIDWIKEIKGYDFQHADNIIVFRDSAFENDETKINMTETLKQSNINSVYSV